ncbi:MAG: type II toxin-antitoxin system YafQ family toxin [Alphaproteobacteria bacterium]|nr:type II toxin-antitoxin system YafQ family toxin [Alphaproteobacteria bacterium]
MKKVTFSGAYERDVRKLIKRGKDLSKLHAVIDALAKGEPLAPRNKPHPLKGAWNPKWDCHIEPDWLLIYEVTQDRVILSRTGTHSDLF